MPTPTLPPRRLRGARLTLAAACVVGVVASSSHPARADIQHVVARGHTIEAIAHRYHVTVKAIVDANHLRDTRHLKVGETLVIPGVTPPKTGPKGAPLAGKGGKPVSYAMRTKTPGVVHALRLATHEDFVVRVSNRRGHVAPPALKSFERLMRSQGGLVHAPDPRLVALVGQVSNHFGGRKLEVVSGFRPYTPTQYTPHSNHNIGRALDFRVVGVPNEVLRDYCKTFHNVGVGYYPNSTFVHLDVRDTSATWIDFSRPGEPPRYNVQGVDADEGTSDVSETGVTPETATPGEAPVAPLPPSQPSTAPVAPSAVAAPPVAAPPVAAPPSPPPAAPAAPAAPVTVAPPAPAAAPAATTAPAAAPPAASP